MKKNENKPYRIIEKTLSNGEKLFTSEFRNILPSGTEMWIALNYDLPTLKEAKKSIERHKFENNFTEKVRYFN